MINRQLLEEDKYSEFYALLTDQELKEANAFWSNEQLAARQEEVAKRQRRVEQERRAKEQERVERYNKRKEAVTYSDRLATEIAERIGSGELLTVICLDEHMPTVRKCNAWLRDYLEFRDLYNQSLQDRLSIFEEQILQIPDEAARDFDEVKSKGTVRRVIDPGKLQAAKLRVEVRRLHLKVGNPAKWGDVSTLVTKDADGYDPANFTTEELEKQIADIEKRSRGVVRAA
jgi:hypothetical protein